MIPEEFHAAVVAHADRLAAQRQNLESEEIKAFWGTPEGLNKIFELLITEYHPELTESEIANIYSQVDIHQVIATAIGVPYEDEATIEENYYREVGLLPPLEKKRQERICNGVNLSELNSDWSKMDRHIFQNFHILPTQLDELTLVEIAAICTPDKQGEAVDATPQSINEVVSAAARYHRLTPKQKLELSKRKYPI